MGGKSKPSAPPPPQPQPMEPEAPSSTMRRRQKGVAATVLSGGEGSATTGSRTLLG
jgi:hypothetical protein